MAQLQRCFRQSLCLMWQIKYYFEYNLMYEKKSGAINRPFMITSNEYLKLKWSYCLYVILLFKISPQNSVKYVRFWSLLLKCVNGYWEYGTNRDSVVDWNPPRSARLLFQVALQLHIAILHVIRSATAELDNTYVCLQTKELFRDEALSADGLTTTMIFALGRTKEFLNDVDTIKHIKRKSIDLKSVYDRLCFCSPRYEWTTTSLR
jgi:hypothetical protein